MSSEFIRSNEIVEDRIKELTKAVAEQHSKPEAIGSIHIFLWKTETGKSLSIVKRIHPGFFLDTLNILELLNFFTGWLKDCWANAFKIATDELNKKNGDEQHG